MNESERLLPISTTFYPFLLIYTLKTLCFQIFIKSFLRNIAKYKVFSDDLLVAEVVTEVVTDCNRLNQGATCTPFRQGPDSGLFRTLLDPNENPPVS